MYFITKVFLFTNYSRFIWISVTTHMRYVDVCIVYLDASLTTVSLKQAFVQTIHFRELLAL